ncbi:MAG: hypothetical protein ACE5D8_09580 [Fidelibacterota bacterium]
MTSVQMFWVFGLLKAITQCVMIVVVFRELGVLDDFQTIGPIITWYISFFYPAFTFIVDYLAFTKKND